MPEAIRIDGLRALTRSLRTVDANLPKALRVALNQAADLIVADAKPRIPRRTGRAAASLKARSTRTAARVQGGSRRVPYFAWLEFGGRVGRRKSVRRAFLREGRYIFPSYTRKKPVFLTALADAVTSLAKSAGLEVTS